MFTKKLNLDFVLVTDRLTWYLTHMLTYLLTYLLLFCPPGTLAQVVTLLTCISDVLVSNLGRDSDYTNRFIVVFRSHSRQFRG
jgi:hypothetical protein